MSPNILPEISRANASIFKAAFFIVVLLLAPADSCIRGGQLRRRVPKEEPPLVYKQHVPNTAEFSKDASGGNEGRISRRSARFRDLVYNENPDIVFKDEEIRRLRGRQIPYEDHYMSVRCREKLDFLSMLVRNTKWTKRVRLRVTEAWDQQGNHGPESLHYEGRALDITTSDRDRRKLGLLARLAVQAGFDYVYYATQGHVHVSCKSDRLLGRRRAFRCFDENSTVTMETGQFRRMGDLKIGDKVQTIDSVGQLKFSPILLFLDRSPGISGDFIRLNFDRKSISDGGLTISPFHLIYRLNSHNLNQQLANFSSSSLSDDFIRRNHAAWRNFVEAVYAENLAPGDRVLLVGRSNMRIQLRTVISRRFVTGQGAYAPLTAEGTIVVDRVIASCYAATSSDSLAHAVMAPVRGFYRLFGNGVNFWDAREQFGIHWYPRVLMGISWFLDSWFSMGVMM